MLRYGFFDSEITGYDEEGMPIFDRAESSDFLAMFISHIISNGVMAQPGDCFQVLAFEGMKLKIRPGFGIVKGRFVFDENDFYITVPNASTSLKRIDRVILRANYPQRLCEIMLIEGNPASDPVPPDLIQPTSGDYYELCLATITVNSNQTVITQSNITDTRYDSSVCGVVTQVIDHIDTSALFAQLNQFYNEFVARSDSSYEKYVADMEAYLEALSTSGDNQLKEIVEVLQNFETVSEEQFLSWFSRMKDQLSEDAAGNLQEQITELATITAEKLEKIEKPVWDDSGEVEGIESFVDFMSLFISGTNQDQFLANLKAGLKYVLHTGQLVNSGMCETPGMFALDAAYGKTLTDQITGLYSDIQTLMAKVFPEKLYLYHNGIISSEYPPVFYGGGKGSYKNSNNVMHITQPANGGLNILSFNTIDFSGYSNIVLTARSDKPVGNSASSLVAGGNLMGYIHNTSFETKSYDITGLNGTGNIEIKVQSYTDGSMTTYITDLYLE